MLVDLYLYKRPGYSSRRILFAKATGNTYIHSVSQKSVNFNPNDQIETTVVMNGTSGTGTYLEVFAEGANPVKDDALSHWFVISYERVIGSDRQCRLKLRRDVLRDYCKGPKKSLFKDNDIYLAKGTIGDTFSPFLLNREDISLNQIKTSEMLLKDETGMKWLVGYVPRDWPQANTSVEVELGSATDYDLEVDDISTLYDGTVYGIKDAYARILISGKWIGKDGSSYLELDGTAYGWKGMDGNMSNETIATYSTTANTYGNARYIQNAETAVHPRLSFEATFKGAMANVNVYDNAVSYIKETKQYDNVDLFELVSQFQNKYNGMKVRDKATGNVYQITVSTDESKYERDISVTKEALPSTFAALSSKVQTSFDKKDYGLDSSEPFTMDNTPGSNSFLMNVSWARFTITREKVVNKASVTIEAASTRPHLEDSPYDMFAIPVGKYLIKDGDKQVNPTNEQLAMSILTAIDTKLGKEAVYDFQLLPYCPVREYIKGSYVGLATSNPTLFYYLDITNAKKNPIADTANTYNYLIWCTNSNFSFNIPFTKEKIEQTTGGITLYKDVTAYRATKYLANLMLYQGDPFDYPDESIVGMGSTPTEIKTRHQCDMLRLCAPNYSGAFEFSSQANNGVKYINVDCSYKPFNPYIHLNPGFGGLYGSDYNDQRGLVCGGDYSLTRLTSAWAEYELSNKNYQSIFDREIQSLEIQQKYQRIGDIVGGIAGAAGAGAGGAAASAIAGMGALPGAIVSGALSGMGAIADYKINESLRAEAMSYRKDMYNYSLGNIKALPYGLAKTTSFNIQNKIWPFLEYYTCTKEERESFKSKLKYSGMTIGAFGRIVDYVPNDGEYHFIQGTLPYIAITSGNQIYLAVKQELEQGVYLNGGDIQ